MKSGIILRVLITSQDLCFIEKIAPCRLYFSFLNIFKLHLEDFEPVWLQFQKIVWKSHLVTFFNLMFLFVVGILNFYIDLTY